MSTKSTTQVGEQVWPRSMIFHISAAAAAHTLGVDEGTLQLTDDASDQIAEGTLEARERQLRESGYETNPNWPELRAMRAQELQIQAASPSNRTETGGSGTDNGGQQPGPTDQTPTLSEWLDSAGIDAEGINGRVMWIIILQYKAQYPKGEIDSPQDQDDDAEEDDKAGDDEQQTDAKMKATARMDADDVSQLLQCSMSDAEQFCGAAGVPLEGMVLGDLAAILKAQLREKERRRDLVSTMFN